MKIYNAIMKRQKLSEIIPNYGERNQRKKIKTQWEGKKKHKRQRKKSTLSVRDPPPPLLSLWLMDLWGRCWKPYKFAFIYFIFFPNILLHLLFINPALILFLFFVLWGFWFLKCGVTGRERVIVGKFDSRTLCITRAEKCELQSHRDIRFLFFPIIVN